jgi:hypothetical protein
MIESKSPAPSLLALASVAFILATTIAGTWIALGVLFIGS